MWRLWWYYVNASLMYLNYTRERLMNQTSCAGDCNSIKAEH